MERESRLVQGEGLVHRVSRPAGSGPFPTVVMIHGWGGDENVMWVFADTVPEGWLLTAPRGPYPDGSGGFIWGQHRPDDRPEPQAYVEAVQALAQFVQGLPQRYGADPTRIYAMGFSQGAVVSFALALAYPELLSGVASLAGIAPASFPAGDLRRALAGKPVFLANGIEDQLVPIAEARESEALLRAAGAQVTYVEEAAGHKLGRRGMQALRQWWRSR